MRVRVVSAGFYMNPCRPSFGVVAYGNRGRAYQPRTDGPRNTAAAVQRRGGYRSCPGAVPATVRGRRCRCRAESKRRCREGRVFQPVCALSRHLQIKDQGGQRSVACSRPTPSDDRTCRAHNRDGLLDSRAQSKSAPKVSALNRKKGLPLMEERLEVRLLAISQSPVSACA